MKTVFLFFFILYSNCISYSQIDDFQDALARQKVLYTYGNNVRLRSAPNTNSETILKVPVAKKLDVMSVSEVKNRYNGILWNWFKVSFNGVEGYVLSGLLSPVYDSKNGDVYLSSIKVDGTKNYILTRLVTREKEVYEYVNNNYSSYWGVKVFGGRGLKGVNSMIYVDFNSESCGDDGGGYYLYNSGKGLKKLAQLACVGDGGYSYLETLDFPEDEKGQENHLIYSLESSKPLDDNYDVFFTKTYSKRIVWKGEEIKIKVPKKYKIGW